MLFNIEGKEESDILRSIEWNELMYVFGNLEGNFTKTFTNEDFHRTQWNVTFDYDNGRTYEAPAPVNLGSAKQSVLHDGKITAPAVDRPGYRFDGWYTEAACINQWNLANDPVHNDMTLYAKWTPNTAGITLSVEAIANGTGCIFPFPPISLIGC